MFHIKRFSHYFSCGLLLLSAGVSLQLSAASIESLRVEIKPHINWVSLDAMLESTKAATVSAQTSGRIIKLNYDINDIVSQGAPLLEITSKEQGAQLAAAEAEYAKANAHNIEAQLQLERYETLFPKGAISRGAMDQARANAKSSQEAVSAARARIVQASESLKYTVVSAPFAGVVTQRHVEEGETVGPGQPLFSGFSTMSMRAVAHVPQRYISALKQRPEFMLTLSDGREINSDALSLFTFVDAATHSYRVRINLPDNTPNLIPGSWIKARFNSGERQTLFIPETALLTMNELSAVYLQRGDKWVLNQIRTGSLEDGRIEVLSGLSTGDTIAVDAYQALQAQKK